MASFSATLWDMAVFVDRCPLKLEIFSRDDAKRPLIDQRLRLRHLAVVRCAQELRADPKSLRLVTDCIRCGNPNHGKPRIVLRDNGRSANVDFNISHCRGYSVLGTTRSRTVGIDAELLLNEEEVCAVETVSSTESEVSMLSQLRGRERSIAATRLWTRKEAVAKAIGAGVAVDFARMQVGPTTERSPWPRTVYVEASPVQVTDGMHGPRLLLSVARGVRALSRAAAGSTRVTN